MTPNDTFSDADAPTMTALARGLTDAGDGFSLWLVEAPPVRHAELAIPQGSTVQSALPALAQALDVPAQALAALQCGIWGQRCQPDTVLRHQDRVEWYRPLRVDPKVARRERFVRQGAKSAGLFAQRRPGAKAGY